MSSPSDQPSPGGADLKGYEVVMAVCGGIAVYKVCQVVSKLVQRDCGVTVIMTEAATHFVGPLTFQALTGRRVFTSMWSVGDQLDHSHIRLTDRADLLIAAPATANIIGKTAGGIADDLVSTLIMSADSPVLMAPAMNARMWSNPIVQRNVELLRGLGYHLVGPEAGWLSCKTVGLGRMAEPEAILDASIKLLKANPPKSRAS